MSRQKRMTGQIIQAGFEARQSFHEAMKQGKRFCYYVSEIPDSDGNYRPSIVVEGEQGHYPMDYTWGPTLEIAKQAALEKNTEMKLTAKDVTEIISSSMAATA